MDMLTAQPVASAILLVTVTYVTIQTYTAVVNLYFHPLSHIPGPKLAAVTAYRKAYIECVVQKSWHLELEDLHGRYGPVVRVGPNELHFSNPKAYNDIYNNSNRWDKDAGLYHSFGEDRSSFGFLTYKEARQRKEVLNKSFSPAAVQSAAPLVLEKIDALCAVLSQSSDSKRSVDLNYAFRSVTMDVITYLAFGKSVDAIHAPRFEAPILQAIDAAGPAFVAFKHSKVYMKMITNCPAELSKILSPPTAGLVDVQQLLGQQIQQLTSDPSKIKHLPHNMTIYHSLMNPEAYKSGTVPERGSLYEESQALLFAGADTSGNALMVAIFHLLKHPEAMEKIKAELASAWPDARSPPPALRELEKLPYFNACIKEALRLYSGVVSGLPRIVPPEHATIDGLHVPGGTCVSMGSTFVHYNADIFPEPHTFTPERWLGDAGLETWLVPFSRGPRACLGMSLAWLEIRYTLASVVRRFDFELDESSPRELRFRDCFLPAYEGPRVKAFLTPVAS